MSLLLMKTRKTTREAETLLNGWVLEGCMEKVTFAANFVGRAGQGPRRPWVGGLYMPAWMSQ